MGWKDKLSDLGSALAPIAPFIGKAVSLANPIAGLAVQAASTALLGRPDGSEDEIASAIAGATPEQIAALRAADYDFAKIDEQERTKRLSLDMKSDSWLSKNIRPMTLIYLLVVYTVLALSDGNLHWDDMSFDIREVYIEGFKVLLFMAAGFYFTSRGLEKISSIIRRT